MTIMLGLNIILAICMHLDHLFEEMKNEMANSVEIKEIIDFIDTSERGII